MFDFRKNWCVKPGADNTKWLAAISPLTDYMYGRPLHSVSILQLREGEEHLRAGRFRNFAQSQRKAPYTVAVQSSFAELGAVLEWIAEHIPSPWTIIPNFQCTCCPTEKFHFGFKYERDALVFKLTWG